MVKLLKKNYQTIRMSIRRYSLSKTECPTLTFISYYPKITKITILQRVYKTK